MYTLVIALVDMACELPLFINLWEVMMVFFLVT